MIIRPQQKLKDLLFYNNLIFIIVVFSIACFFTSINLNKQEVKSVYVPTNQAVTVGPIKVNEKAKIYKIKASWHGHLSSSYLTGEVMDEDKDTLYEFGKDFWHEEGYDSEGYWSESERNLEAYLSFTEKGTYYIKFYTENGRLDDIQIKMTLMKASYVVHSMVGCLALLFALIMFCMLNHTWLWETMELINEKLEEMSDD